MKRLLLSLAVIFAFTLISMNIVFADNLVVKQATLPSPAGETLS